MADEPIGDYRDLVCWQRAIELALVTDDICDRLPRRHWRLADQMRRAGNSVHSSIAEGNGTFTTADYLRFLGMSNASLNELESDLHFLHRRYGNREDVIKAQGLAIDVRKPLWGLIKALRRKRDDGA
jgi:four helix bundle protein